MNPRKSLGRKKFNAILIASVLEMVVDVMMSIIDTAVTGHVIGTIGLSALNIVAPITGITIFTENLFATGTSMLYANYAGKYETDKADKAFGMGIIMSLIVGIGTSLAISAILPLYLSYMNVSDTIMTSVNQFMTFIRIELAITPLFELIVSMIFADGDEILGTAANVSETVLNIVLSIILGKKMGMMGISLGSLLSVLVSSCLLAAHFFKKKNTLRPRFSLNLKDVKRAVFFGANDSAMFFLLPIMFFVITKFILWRFGEFYLPVLSVINSIIELTVVFEASGEAMRPILPIYRADNNTNALKELLIHSLIINLVLGAGFSIFLLSAGSLIPEIFDIEDPGLQEVCTTCLRFYAIGCPGMAVAAEMNSYFLNTGRTKLALYENVLNQLVSILVLVFPFGFIWGINGIWIAFAAAPYLTLVVLALSIQFLIIKGIIPTPLPQKSKNILSRTIDLNTDELMEYIYNVHDFLSQHEVDAKLSSHVEVTMEECLILLRDINLKAAKGTIHKDTIAECTIRVFDGGVDFSVWDSGIVFDVTDGDMSVSDLHSYFISRMLRFARVKKHKVVVSFNRNFLHFDANDQ